MSASLQHSLRKAGERPKVDRLFAFLLAFAMLLKAVGARLLRHSMHRRKHSRRALDGEIQRLMSHNDGIEGPKWEYGSFRYGESDATSSPNHDVYDDVLFDKLTPVELDKSIEILKEYCKPERFAKLSSVIEQRSDNVRFVFENPSNANNVWASLRSLDAFGVQYINLVIAKEQYSQQWRRRQMNEAMGTQKYLSITQAFNTVEEIERLKSHGYKIYATDLNANSSSLADTNWDVNKKIAIVMGNEVNGISEDVKRLSDAFVKIPMKGFAESLNLSVSVAVIGSFLDEKKLIYPNLSDTTRKKLLVAWMCRSIRSSLLLLKRNNIQLK